MSNPHPHAALMMQYAQDAAETDKPWWRWECRLDDSHPWESINHNPGWSPGYSYRRKPKTIKVNGFDVPEPLKSLSGLSAYWYPDPFASAYCNMQWPGEGTFNSLAIERGLVHATKEAAVAHAKAMLGIDPEGTV